MKALPLGLALALVFALAACGGDDTKDEDQITEVIERAGTTADPAVCTEIETQRFVEQAVGGGSVTGEAAIKACEKNADRGVADDVEVSEVAVDGDRATANAAFTGSTFDSQTLILSLVDDGGQWKLNEVTGFAEFDREALIASYEEELSAGGVPAQGVACVREQFESLQDDQLQAYVLSPTPANVELVFGKCEQLLGP